MRCSNAPVARLTCTEANFALHAVAVSAVCNAFNTLALGLMALMRFESKSMLHTRSSLPLTLTLALALALALTLALLLLLTLTLPVPRTRGACCLQSLKVRQLELRDKLQQIVHGFQHQDQHTAADTFWRSWSMTIIQLHAKAQETMEMIPGTHTTAYHSCPPG